MSYIPESALDYDEIIRRGGTNAGDEDFALCKCPTCGKIYMVEYEVDTIFLDGTDLAKRTPCYEHPSNFKCIACGQKFPEGAWIGPKAPQNMQVTYEELHGSPWKWAIKSDRKV